MEVPHMSSVAVSLALLAARTAEPAFKRKGVMEG